jgi:toxin FitB
MILLDTNVISEQMRQQPLDAVMKWFDSIDGTALYLSAITEAELLRGVSTMPDGKTKSTKAAFLNDILGEVFAGFILPFDSQSAYFYAEIFSHRKNAGRPISVFDCMIAAIARSNDCKLATRNVVDFEHCGLEIINPWNYR